MVGPPPLSAGEATSRPRDPVDTLTFDSDALPARERFERYRTLYSAGADAVQTGPDMVAKVIALQLDQMNLYDRRLNEIAHHRCADRVIADGFDHLTVTMVLAGDYAVDTGAGHRPIAPGCAVVIDTRLPMRNRTRHAHVVTISISRMQFIGAVGVVDGMHGHVVGASDAALAIDFVQAVLRRRGTLSASTTGPATHALLTLVAAAIGASAGASDPSATAIRDAMRIARVRTLIDANLGDPGFGTDQVVAMGGIARATLYRAFRAHGGIAAYIRGRRIERLRAALADPRDDRSFARMVVEAGLKTEAYASRLFLDQFGQRPGEYRATVAVRLSADEPATKMTLWQAHLKELPVSGGGTSQS